MMCLHLDKILPVLWSLFLFCMSCIVLWLILGLSWSWSYGSWICNYLCSQCLSPLTLWVWIPLRWDVHDTTLCDQVCHWLMAGRWFSPGIPISSINKTDRHDITEILLKVVLNTINHKPWIIFKYFNLFV